MLFHFASDVRLVGEQFMNPGQGPSGGMSEQYNRGPPGPTGNMQLGHRQQYGPYGPGYERRYETLAELLYDTLVTMCSLSHNVVQYLHITLPYFKISFLFALLGSLMIYESDITFLTK